MNFQRNNQHPSFSASCVTPKILVRGLFVVIVFAAVFAVLVLELNSAGNPFLARVDSVQVRVLYNGSWQGAIGGTGPVSNWNGTGDKVTVLSRPVGAGGSVWVVSSNAQKYDGSQDVLTISILKMDGSVLKSASTNAAFGVAQVVVNVDRP